MSRLVFILTNLVFGLIFSIAIKKYGSAIYSFDNLCLIDSLDGGNFNAEDWWKLEMQ